MKTHNLNLKKHITPSRRPVHYLPLKNKNKEKKAKLKRLYYLNNPTSLRLALDAEEIMSFEQLFFENYAIMLKHLGVFEANNTVSQVIDKALSIK